MSRVTPPVHRAIRSISSSAHSARSSALLDSQTRQAQYLPQRHSELKAECVRRQLKTSGSKGELAERLVAHDITRASSSSARPTSSFAATTNLRPLMQGFHTTSSLPAPTASPTIDHVFFPVPSATEYASFSLRVPLLPDNYSPDRSVGSAHALETPVEPLLRNEISIIAARPENVTVASALTEVVSMAGELTLADLTRAFGEKVEEVKVPGALKALWEDLMDDVLGEKAKVVPS